MVTTPQESQQQSSVDTVKDIAGLYSRLQAAVNDKSVNDEAKFIPLPPSLPMSPSSSSPTPLRISRLSKALSTPRSSSSSDGKPGTVSEECVCQHILADRDSLDCSLCGRTIPIMEQLQREKKMHEQEVKDLEIRLQEEQGKITQQLEEIETLQASLAKVEGELRLKDEEFAALQKDMEILNEKYVDEIERVAEIQHSKDMVESELEDLSRRLFEEANGMVAHEKREKHNLEVAQKHLEMQLRETQDRLAAEQMQLRELREKMQEMAQEQEARLSATPTPVSSGEDNEDTQSVATASDSVDHRSARDMSLLFSDRSSLQISALPVADTVDQMLLAEFEEFVKTSASVPLKKLHTLPFMKHCQVEDIEPCLRFGANARLSARKVSEAIVLNTCFIEETPPGFLEEQAQRPSDVPLRISASKNLLWERISNGGNPISITNACQACGRQDQDSLPYRFRTSYFDDWACIDRYCRDRLVAVCEFFVFIRNVRQGYYKSRSIPDLYHEIMRLRLQMFYARMGALPWRLRSLGLKGEEVGKASPPQMRIPPPSNSESSPLPRSGSHRKEKAQRHTSAHELSVKPSTSASPSKSTNNTPSPALFILNGPI